MILVTTGMVLAEFSRPDLSGRVGGEGGGPHSHSRRPGGQRRRGWSLLLEGIRQLLDGGGVEVRVVGAVGGGDPGSTAGRGDRSQSWVS